MGIKIGDLFLVRGATAWRFADDVREYAGCVRAGESVDVHFYAYRDASSLECEIYSIDRIETVVPRSDAERLVFSSLGNLAGAPPLTRGGFLSAYAEARGLQGKPAFQAEKKPVVCAPSVADALRATAVQKVPAHIARMKNIDKQCIAIMFHLRILHKSGYEGLRLAERAASDIGLSVSRTQFKNVRDKKNNRGRG